MCGVQRVTKHKPDGSVFGKLNVKLTKSTDKSTTKSFDLNGQSALENREPQEYHDCLNRYFALHEMQSLHDVEVAIQSCAQVCNTTENQTESKP